MISVEILAGCALIFVARVCDVSLGTVRTIAVVHGRALLSASLGFVEVLIWVYAVSHAVRNLSSPFYAIAYALGFATGSYVGILLERRIGLGRQVVRVFSRTASAVVNGLREHGFRVTIFKGQGRDGEVDMLFVETNRTRVAQVLRLAAAADSKCYYIVDDVRHAANAQPPLTPAARGWRSILVRK